MDARLSPGSHRGEHAPHTESCTGTGAGRMRCGRPGHVQGDVEQERVVKPGLSTRRREEHGPMIIDSHAHLHPSQADLADWDFDGTEAALRHQQRILYAYHRPQAVTASGETVKDAWKLLWDERQPYSWAGRTEVNFRIEHERFIWEKDQVTYSAPVRPAADAARLIALMDAVGVDKAVLQASLPYSRFYGRMMRAYPGRFLPLGILQDDGDIDTAVAGLHAMVADGLAGVYQNPIPGWPGFDDCYTPRFDPVWREVE